MEKIDHCKISHSCPKAELHIHIEGTFEPSLVMKLSNKYGVNKYSSQEELQEKYKFTCLKDFLDLYYSCCDVLREEEDFAELMTDYLKKSSSQGLKYAEIFFDPQSHLNRNIPFSTIINGLRKGQETGEKLYGVESNLIMCFLRDLSQEEALKVLDISLEHKDKFIGIGLDSNELGNPPEKFTDVYKKAKEAGLRLVAHAGEECSIPTDYIYSALDTLKVERIDHGVQVRRSEELMQRIANDKIPLTLCPLSNIKLKVHNEILESPLMDFLSKGILVMINSDDPAYFGGYIGDNYLVCGEGFNFTLETYKLLCINSFKATFLSDEKKSFYINEVEKYFSSV